MTDTDQTARPFDALLAYAGTYFHPEGYYDSIAGLKTLCARPEDEQPARTRRFKFEVREVLLGNTEGLGEDDIWDEAHYADGSDAWFLRRVWAQCFPAEPIPGGPTGPFDALLSVTYVYFASPDDPEDNYGHRGQLVRQLAAPEERQTPLLRAIKPDLANVITGQIVDQPANMLRREATYVESDDQAFARRMWAYLFPTEPIPGEEAAGPSGPRSDLIPLPDLPLDQPALR